jgi:hypothetical protein
MTELLGGTLHQIFHRFNRSQVCFESQELPPEFLHGLFGFGCVDIINADDIRSGFGESQSHTLTQSR